VLLLVGLSGRLILRAVAAIGLLILSLYGLAISSSDTSVNGAYLAFTCTVLLWGAQEITFLAGWVTGPRPEACPEGARGARRFVFALQAILYHELMLIACGVAVAFLTWTAANQVGLSTFATLWILRQSAKINLFLGVPVTNDELMPDAVRFLKSYFAKKPVSAFFPLSVSASTAILVIMIQRLVEVAVTPFEIAGLALVSMLFALGILEHWFMLLPLPAMTLWGWGIKTNRPPTNQLTDAALLLGNAVAGHDLSVHSSRTQPCATSLDTMSPVQPVALTLVRNDESAGKARQMCARQRLEDQFRQSFLENRALGNLPAARRNVDVEPAGTGSRRTS
jgi:putative photosynthetic complex assembly protein 2